jgi:hypothetical protein
VRLTAREVVTVVERALVCRGYDRGIALVAAEYLLAGELDTEGYVTMLRSVLAELRPSSPVPVIRMDEARHARLDADNAFSLVVAANVLDVLELDWRAATRGGCVVVNLLRPEFLGTLAGAGRARGLEVRVSVHGDRATCRVEAPCGVPQSDCAAATLEVAEEDWTVLDACARGVLSTAGEGSRSDAGY